MDYNYWLCASREALRIHVVCQAKLNALVLLECSVLIRRFRFGFTINCRHSSPPTINRKPQPFITPSKRNQTKRRSRRALLNRSITGGPGMVTSYIKGKLTWLLRGLHLEAVCTYALLTKRVGLTAI